MKIFGTLLALFSQLLVISAQAADPMDAAVAAVAATHEAARNTGRLAATEDLNFALAEAMVQFAKNVDVSEVRRSLLTEQKDLEAKFAKIALMNPSQIANVQEEFARAFETYKDLVRRRYSASYVVTQAREDSRQSLLLAIRAFQVFESNCSTGRGVGGKGVEAFSYPNLPRSEFRVSVNYGPNTGFSNSYQATGSGAENERNNVVNVTATAATITSSIALSGGTGAAVAMAQAVAPFMLGGAAVVAVAALYISEQEKIKAENRIVEAKVHAFRESADDRSVAKAYKEHCAAMSKDLRRIREVLNAAVSDSAKLEALVASVPDLDQEVEKFRKLSETRTNAHIKATAALEAPEKDEKKISEAVAELKKADAELQKASEPEKIAAVMSAFLLDKEARLISQLGSLSFQAVDLAQRKAFRQIQALAFLVAKKNFQRFLSGGDEIGSELRALDQFARARSLFRDVLAAQIQLIFGRVEARVVAEMENRLRGQAKDLVRAYGHVPDVTEFARQVKALTGSLETR